MTMTIEMIPVAKLSVSALNVRKTAPDKAADKRLMASIASQGVLQNLVVVPEGQDRFGVVAGGRRLRALQALVKEKTLPDTAEVRCLVKTQEDDITEISLAENIGQEAMHPADQFVAFTALKTQGVCTEDIAAKFGVTAQVVEKRLRLGQVAPKLLDEYRRDKLNLESLMAFTVSADQKRQWACYQDLSGRAWPHAVKSWLLGESVDASRGIGAFVGKAAYLKAGGAGAQDLFEETFYLSDTALVCELAQAKLARAAKKLEKEEGGWLWIETTLDRHQSTEGLVQLYAEHVGVPADLTQAIDALEKQITAWDELYYDDELAEGFDDEDTFSAAIEDAQEEVETLDDQRDSYLQFSEVQQAYAGCLVTFNGAGKLEIVRGVARKKDLPKKTGDNNDGGQGAQTSETTGAGLSAALLNDLGQYRQQVVKAALLRDSAAAFDVLHYSLCLQVLSNERWLGRNLLDAGFQTVASGTSREDTQQGRAFDELAAAHKALSLAWLEHGEGAERFAAFRKLSRKAKDKLVTYCTAQLLTIGVRGTALEQDVLIDQLDVDFAAYWRPTKDNYFGRLTKGQLCEQFAPLLGQAWSEQHADGKKGTVVESVETRFNAEPTAADDPIRAWIPEQF